MNANILVRCHLNAELCYLIYCRFTHWMFFNCGIVQFSVEEFLSFVQLITILSDSGILEQAYIRPSG